MITFQQQENGLYESKSKSYTLDEAIKYYEEQPLVKDVRFIKYGHEAKKVVMKKEFKIITKEKNPDPIAGVLRFKETEEKGEYEVLDVELLRDKWKTWNKRFFNNFEVGEVTVQALNENIEVRIIPRER